MSTAPWQVYDATAIGGDATLGSRWAWSARAVVRDDTLALALRLDRASGKRPREGATVILHDVPRSELQTLATALRALAAQVDGA
ncbi:MAG: hypothetical protein MUF00_08670 [Gemmatimonadaceae bacterium]|jgi:hypothetical protein|nr:hypothetical protein [Gemmatimonadaceae bacterium]